MKFVEIKAKTVDEAVEKALCELNATKDNVDIEILSNDRTGLLADIVKEITTRKINIMGVNTKTNKDRIATIDITIEVKDIQELNTIVKAIRKVDSVYEVNRKK